MIKIITYVSMFMLLFVTNSFGQVKDFDAKIKALSNKIETIVSNEKAQLKQAILKVEEQYNKDQISLEEVKQAKNKLAMQSANAIKTKVGVIEKEIHNLVQNKVDNQVDKEKTDKSESNEFVVSIDKDKISFGKKKSKKSKPKKDKRTHSYMVFSYGLNNLMKDGDFNSIQNSDFDFWKSRSFEFGLNYKTRLLKNSGALYLNYGLSLRQNNLRAKNNQFFVTTNDDTMLQTHTVDLKKSRFRATQLVIPVFFEIDLSKTKTTKKGKKIFKRNKSWRFGAGGFAGISVRSTQLLKYKQEGRRVKHREKGDFNVNKFVYGLQGQIGYKDTSLFVKYDMQDLFKQSFTNQKNISFGLRFDL